MDENKNWTADNTAFTNSNPAGIITMGGVTMEENSFWLKNEGVKIIHQLMGLVQWSDMGRCDEHKTPILKKLMELEQRLKKI